jgi:hypothetical protein
MLIHYNYDTFDLMLPVLGTAVPAEFIYEDGAIAGLAVVMEGTPGIDPEMFKRV